MSLILREAEKKFTSHNSSTRCFGWKLLVNLLIRLRDRQKTFSTKTSLFNNPTTNSGGLLLSI